MGLFDKLKAANEERKRRDAAQAAQFKYNVELTQWQKDYSLGERLLKAVEACRDGSNAVSVEMVLKKGEHSIWSGPAGLIETRKTAGGYVGKSRGVSIPIGHTGLRYRVGASSGTFVPGKEYQSVVDSGTVTLSNQRVVFTGQKESREWSFSKWLGADANSSETIYLFHVSNRQKVSGLGFNTVEVGHEFNRFLGLALQIQDGEFQGELEELRASVNELTSKKPQEPKAIE